MQIYVTKLADNPKAVGITFSDENTRIHLLSLSESYRRLLAKDLNTAAEQLLAGLEDKPSC